MDSQIQTTLKKFRENWNADSLRSIGGIVEAADSEIRPSLLQAIIACEIENRLGNGIVVVAEDFRELGNQGVRIAEQRLAIQVNSDNAATIAPSDVNVDDQATIAPGRPEVVNKATIGEQFLHFELIEEIARGGMGVVYKARDKKLNRIVALKMIIAGKLASEEERFRFNVEAEAAAKLDHPGITPIYEVGEHAGQQYFAMKLVEGGSLADCLGKYKTDPRIAARLVADIAHAIHHAHQRGTLHRDLKPNNILLDPVGRPLVTDFGLAKLEGHHSDVTQTGVMMGTPGYMPPEQVASSKDVTTAADVYSLGAILFATLTGRPPFVGGTAMETVMQVVQQEPPKLSSVNSKAPIELELIVEKCLNRDPNKRYSTAGELAKDLENWLAGESISVRAPSVTRLARQWMKQNIRMASVSLLIGACIALIATPLCLLGFGQDRLPGRIYEQLPAAPSPPLAGLSFGLPDLDQRIEFLFIIFAVFLVSSAGAIAVGWLKPDSMNDAIGIGIIAGIAVGISLFLLLFGWLIGGSAAMSYAQSDLSLLTISNDEQGDRFASELIRWRYPDLENTKSESELRTVLRQKIVQDTQLMMGLGNAFAAVLTSLFFLPVVLASGFYFRLQKNRDALFQRILAHVEFVLLAVLLSLGLIWLLVTIFTWVLPAGSFNGPKPRMLVMVVSVGLSATAIWGTWNFKHWLLRAVLIGASVVFFAWFASGVLVSGSLDRDVKRLIESNDFGGAAKRHDLQTRQGGSWFGSGASAIVMAAYDDDEQLHRELHLRFQDYYMIRENLYQFRSTPLFLEAMLLTPETSEFLPRMRRLIEYVEKFSTVENYGTHRHQVLALAELRRGNDAAAMEYLSQVPIDDFARAYANDESITHHQLDDFKAVAIKSMLLHKAGELEQAKDELNTLYLLMPRIRKWAHENDRQFGLVNRLYYSLEILLNEAIATLSDGAPQSQWIEANLEIVDGKPSSE